MRTLLAAILLMMSIFSHAQNYSSLWKQAEEAEQKDLPRTQYDILMKIVAKAQKEGEYGQLMAAELAGSRVMAMIAPDSLQPAVERMQQRRQAATDKVLATVYATVLKKIYDNNSQLERPRPGRTSAADGAQEGLKTTEDGLTVTLDAETCERLAAVKAADYKPLITIGRDSKLFNDDLLSVIGYELGDFRPLHDYYSRMGNRRAAMMTALEIARQGQEQGWVEYGRAKYIKTLDSLIAIYGDLPEAAEIAIERYEYMARHTDATPAQLWDYAEQAISRWSDYRNTNELRNAQMTLTTRQFNAMMEPWVGIPDRTQKMDVELRNIDQLTMRLYRVKDNGTIRLNPSNDEDYKKLKPLLTELPELQVTRRYSGHKAYDLFKDSIEVPALPVGVYMIELRSNPETEVSRRLYYVSNVRVLALPLPGEKVRYVVVDATEGQPLSGATVELYSPNYRRDAKMNLLAQLTTDSKGEAVYELKASKTSSPIVFAYTKKDNFCPYSCFYGQFYYQEDIKRKEQTHVYTDRAIYRPGQTVHVAAISYVVTDGYKPQALENCQLTLTLRDANHKEVAEKMLTTDKYGTCATEFTLPANGLTGQFQIECEGGSTCYIRVEEYKRPTFEVEFDKVNDDYKDGDILEVKATARSYAGVPVQDAKVKYRVVRRRSLWWLSYSAYYERLTMGESSDNETVAEGEAVTASDGTFTVSMPLELPKTDYPMFYNFVCTADVTDQGGETHQGQLSLPLGNRKTALSCDLPGQVCVEKMADVKFHLLNAAGNDIDAEVRYHFDNSKWLTVKSNTLLAGFCSQLKSGKHTLEAICQGDTLKQDFVVFSLDDKRPATVTDDWFYQSDYQFANDGSPVTVQAGSSAKDVRIFYSIFSGNSIVESGSVERSNELINREFNYKEEYGNGLTMNFAWVKQGKCYTHVANIQRPLPDKRLKLKWQTFRDRLTPGQQEEWTLTIVKPDGTAADAQLMATLYDKSLDQIAAHNWWFSPWQHLPLPRTSWQSVDSGSLYFNGSFYQKRLTVYKLDFSAFDSSLFPHPWMARRLRGRAVGGGIMLAKQSAMSLEEKTVEAAAANSYDELAMPSLPVTTNDRALQGRIAGGNIAIKSYEKASGLSTLTGYDEEAMPDVPLRENLQETAFFYPQLTTDGDGLVKLKFTLPESLTTWRFMGQAHTADLCYGTLEGEAVAKKDLMVQPNMPRFLRQGDKASISARIFNTSESELSGTAFLTLTNPETEKAVYTSKVPFTVKAGETTSVQFTIDNEQLTIDNSLLVCKVMATTDLFSDGEQHYLPVLPNSERVTVTRPFTQNEPGTETIDLTKLVPAGVKDAKLTFEYTNNPAWLMIQTLPAIGHPYDDCAICQSASLYANSLGKYIVDQVPQAKNVFEQWKRESSSLNSPLSTLNSQLEKNQELKDLVLNETPWQLDADRETEQRQRLADFFDENLMQQRLQSAIDKLGKLQRGDGSWSWWPDMPGSTYMTITVAEMMVRQNTMMGEQEDTKLMLKGAMKFLGREMVDLVKEMKKQEKKGYKPTFPSFTALQWLYVCKLDGRQLPNDVREANDYLIRLLKKETKRQTIYEKALSAIILNSPTYIKSLKEYTVYREDMGRYYDTPRAGYSWRDYRIPTQVAAIEAIQRLAPDDRQTLDEMRRWLLQQKHTQAWDTPVNSVDAVYAFLMENGAVKSEKLIAAVPTALKLDGQPLETPKATAGVGYVKTAKAYTGEKTFTAEKLSQGTSWGAVYAQFMQTAADIDESGSGMTVKREILQKDKANPSSLSIPQAPLKVGDRVTVRLTIVCDRDLDFVQVQDKRAACMEPLSQLSGYNWRGGYYAAPHDNRNDYFFDRLSKGKHVIETEFFIDRPGTYQTGTCTVQCAYAPEFRATGKAVTLVVTEGD